MLYHAFILLFNSRCTSDGDIGSFITFIATPTMYVLDTRYSESHYVGITSCSHGPCPQASDTVISETVLGTNHCTTM